ncbi:hypothetical protein J1605_007476 [Eschrichtius robustus]|uniref:Uncharacterized protein n=1 Tax=Eschrichtius robustus TaxID=9764 RepID=A0AB34H2J7_ESCRO|nr:hypothetical protein J1605_007476 [Eschrichtius robustus]
MPTDHQHRTLIYDDTEARETGQTAAYHTEDQLLDQELKRDEYPGNEQEQPRPRHSSELLLGFSSVTTQPSPPPWSLPRQCPVSSARGHPARRVMALGTRHTHCELSEGGTQPLLCVCRTDRQSRLSRSWQRGILGDGLGPRFSFRYRQTRGAPNTRIPTFLPPWHSGEGRRRSLQEVSGPGPPIHSLTTGANRGAARVTLGGHRPSASPGLPGPQDGRRTTSDSPTPANICDPEGGQRAGWDAGAQMDLKDK